MKDLGMRSKALVAAVVACGALLASAAPALATQYIQGGDFEGGVADGEGATDHPKWTEADNVYGSPICEMTGCGTGGGTAGPHGGTAWIWFGGTSGSADQVSSVTQTITLPSDQNGAISFYFRVGVFGKATSVFTVQVDGATYFKVDVTNQAEYLAYQQVIVPLGRLAAGPHLVSFAYTSSGPGAATNLSIDDARLDAFPAAPLTAPVAPPTTTTTTTTSPTVSAPDTAVLKATARKSGTAKLSFSGSGGAGTLSFECKLDKGGFVPCASAKRYSGLKAGRHSFQVRAVDATGRIDLTPATSKFTVPKPA
jgi:hypothetical protein